MRRRLPVYLLIFVGIAASVVPAPRESVKLTRVYGATGLSRGLFDLSRDGKKLLLATHQDSRCPDGRRGCSMKKLVVSDTTTGETLGEWASPGEITDSIVAAQFAADGKVLAIHGLWPNWVKVEWDPLSGKKLAEPRTGSAGTSPVCFTREGRELESRSDQGALLLSVPGESPAPGVRWYPPVRLFHRFDCHGWRSGSSLMLEQAQKGRPPRLEWMSVWAGETRGCAIQFDEPLHGYAVAPDGSIAVAVTGKTVSGPNDDRDVFAAEGHFSLKVIQRGSCDVAATRTLQFSNKPEERKQFGRKDSHLANGFLKDWFARSVAVSPDNTKVAIAYGVRTGDLYSDALAYFEVFSLRDGRLLATLKGDLARNGLWESLRRLDAVPTSWVPICGVLFSPDSRTLYGCSDRMRQWDISGLQ
jgi:hypothetical protein